MWAVVRAAALFNLKVMKLNKIFKNIGKKFSKVKFGKKGAGVILATVGGVAGWAALSNIGDDDEDEVLTVTNDNGEQIEGRRRSLSEMIVSASDGIDITEGELLALLKELVADINPNLFAVCAGGVETDKEAEGVALILSKYASGMMEDGISSPQEQIDYANLLATVGLLQMYHSDSDAMMLNTGDVADQLIAAAFADPYMRASKLEAMSEEEIAELVDNVRNALISRLNSWLESNDIQPIEWRALEYGCIMYEALVGLETEDNVES